MFVNRLTKFIEISTMLPIWMYGLWPHRFDGKIASVIFFAYSLTFSSASLVLFYIYTPEIFSKIQIELRSCAIVLLDKWYLYSIVLLYIAMYGGVYLNHRKIRRFITRAAYLYDIVTRSGVCFRRVLIKFLAKSLAYDLVYSLVVIMGPLQLSESPYSDFFGSIVINIVPSVVRVIPNLYYGCIVGGQWFYQNINNRIELLRERIKTEAFAVESVCDELDALSVEHFRHTQLMNECNEICSLPVVLRVVSMWLELLFQITLQIVLRRRGYMDLQFANTVLFSMALWDLYATFTACDRILRKAKSTSTLLLSILYEGINLDEKVRRSIQDFTTHTLQNKLSQTGCGMFDLRLSAFRAVMVTIISHSFILIQFEFSST